MTAFNAAKREQFAQDGFYLFEQVLESAFVEKLQTLSDDILAQQDAAHFEEQRTTGSMVLIDWEMAYQHDIMAELIAHPKMMGVLAELGFDDPKFGHGRVISKPPHSPPLFWHEDGRFWDDPVSYTPQPIQCFIMVYLTPTTPENGCLRVIPGSHRKRHALHDAAAAMHTDALRTYEDPDHIQFQHAEGEVDVSVNVGDVVFGYGNIFHAAHANRTDERRTVLTLWYYPDFVNLPERTQATVQHLEGRNRMTESDVGAWQKAMEPMKILYDGDAEPIEQQWVPGEQLK
ncbi:MAG: phytanoyl-CoA dioxygenase family protein [Chloroflexota bacterium]